ncbi:serine/threonine protein kinase [Streptomyces armeniacus]|uniref:non-specific serine/threonine protein kinase n=2 Tax=Streptomyces armeniacus TaxID=83291 RepID=A0A345XZL6_9ACTN|nr:serine/threonine protein kinase [Streptomyces armeniacus]
MGVVCRAMDEVLGREVAVKELRAFSDAAPSELADLRLRMQREARAAARVRHPGVIAVHDIAEHEGRPVIVMELVHGPSLDDVLRDQGTLPPQRVADIGAKVLDALAAAHRAGVLHRDVKPGNILLEQGGRVVLTDFGIAAVEDPGDGSATRITGSGDLVGSLDYLAPERARGEQPGPGSDVWSLGATLYAALEGASPFRRTSTWSTLTAIVVEPLPEPRNAGPLGPVLAELMDKDPARRADAERAAALLTAAAEGAAPPTADTVRLGRGAGDGGTPPGAAGGQPTPPAGGHGAGPVQAEGGFGPPPADVPGSAPAPGPAPVPGPGSEPGPDTGRQTVRTGPAASRRGRRRAAVAASVAAVLIAGAGVTYAVVGGDSGGASSAAPSESRDSTDPGTESRADGGQGTGDEPDDSRSSPEGSAGERTKEAGTAGGSSDGGKGGKGGDDRGEDAGPAPGGDGSGGSSGGGGTGGGGQDPKPACHAIGGGKFNCRVWRTATSYNKDHRAVGRLNAGTNYFFCQKRLPYRETSGEWTNVWWARTDDDSGNTGVYVSVVYVRGGDNDRPVPGLPTCRRVAR